MLHHRTVNGALDKAVHEKGVAEHAMESFRCSAKEAAQREAEADRREAEARRKLSAARQETELTLKRLEAAEGKAMASEEVIQELEGEVALLTEEVKSAESDREAARSSLERMEEAIKAKDGSIASLTEEKEMLEARLASALQRLQEVERQHILDVRDAAKMAEYNVRAAAHHLSPNLRGVDLDRVMAERPELKHPEADAWLGRLILEEEKEQPGPSNS